MSQPIWWDQGTPADQPMLLLVCPAGPDTDVLVRYRTGTLWRTGPPTVLGSSPSWVPLGTPPGNDALTVIAGWAAPDGAAAVAMGDTDRHVWVTDRRDGSPSWVDLGDVGPEVVGLAAATVPGTPVATRLVAVLEIASVWLRVDPLDGSDPDPGAWQRVFTPPGSLAGERLSVLATGEGPDGPAGTVVVELHESAEPTRRLAVLTREDGAWRWTDPGPPPLGMSGGSHLAFGAVAGRGYAAVEGYGVDPDPVVMLWHGARTSWTWTLLGQPAGQVGWPVGVAAAADPATGAAVPAVIALAGVNEQYELWRSDLAGSWDRIGTPVADTLVRSVAGNVADPVTRPLAVVSGDGRRVWSVRVETAGPAWTELPALPSTVGDVVAGLMLDTPPEAGYHVVTVGTDGRLWTCRWNGFEWYWSDHGRPTPEVAAWSGVGAVAGPGSTRPYHVAVLGSDGGLWCRSMTGTTWSWTDHGTPGGQPVRAVAPPLLVPGSGAPQLQVAAWGLDGQVWVRVPDGASWRWDGRGSPPGVTTFGFVGAGVGLPPAGGPDGLVAFVISNDGVLWGSWLDGAAPQWASLGRPKAGLGAVAGIGVAPFVAAPDGPTGLRVVVLDGTQRHLWVTTWPPREPWTDVPPPAGVAVSGSLGVITDPDDAARSAVLVPGTDRHLWLLSLGAADHRWEDWGLLPTTGRVRGRAVDARVGNRSNPTHRSPAAPVCSDDGRLVISVRYPS